MRIITALLTAGLVVASCGGTTGAPPAAASPAAPAPSAPGEIVLPKPEKTSVKYGASAFSGAGSIVPVLTRQLGLFQKYGLTVEKIQFNGAGPAMQAMLAGQIDVNDNSAAPVLATIGTSSHAQIVFVPRANNKDILYSAANIKSAADLRGKNVAISSFGSNSYGGALTAIKELGLTDKDVTLTTVGSDTQRLAALKSGAVAASIQDSTIEKELNALGFNSLVRMRDLKVQIGQPNGSVVVPVEFQKKYPNTVLAIVATYLEAEQTFRNLGAKGAAPHLIKEIPDLSLAEAERQLALELEEPYTPKDGMCRAEDMAFAKQVAVSANPALANVDALQACNNSYLLKLRDLGFQKKLGIPGY